MSSISFFHCASIYKNATEKVVENTRKYHPDNYYFLCVDATQNFSYLAESYKTDYRYYIEKLGGPQQPYGYETDKVLKFLERFYEACKRSPATHMMMLEDDVWLSNRVIVDDSWEMACHDIEGGNFIHPEIIKMAEEFSGVKVEERSKCYGGGGGSIYKIDTFIKNYDRVTDWFAKNTEQIQKYYPTIGWIDCFMVVYYLLCGKQYTKNPFLVDTHNHQTGFDYEKFVSEMPTDTQIINNYKKYYYE